MSTTPTADKNTTCIQPLNRSPALDWTAVAVTSPSEGDGEGGALEHWGVCLSANKGRNGICAAVLLRFDVLVVVGLANPLLLVVLVGLDSFELVVEGGEGRCLIPVDDDDEWGVVIIEEPEADIDRGLFMLLSPLYFRSIQWPVQLPTLVCQINGKETLRRESLGIPIIDLALVGILFDRWAVHPEHAPRPGGSLRELNLYHV